MPNKRSSLTFGILLSCLLLLTLLPVAQANTFEDRIAHRFIRNYAQNEHRLQAIRRELDALPQPYQREPTGTGGFMSHPRKRSSNKISLSFEWKQHTQIDSVALFPLRLFMDEIYDENLYWPAQFSIEVIGKGQTNIVASGSLTAPQLPLSLPELIEFDPVSARKLTIRLTGLPQHPVQKWYAAGLAEILIFSGNENVAPRATCTTSSSRQGFYVLANNFVTDGQTPLGLPEINDPSKTHSFRKIIVPQKIPKTPYRLTLSYADPVDLDCVRIDPAIEHSYGQSFPLRFQIDLLDETGTVLQSDQTYADFPLRNPGLNPHYSYFPTTKTTSICLTVLEASQPTPAARPAISFSEITAVLQGNHLKAPDIIEEKFQGKVIRLDRSLVLQNKGSTLKYLCDGWSQSGKLIPMHEWVTGLVRRKQLLGDQANMQQQQARSMELLQLTLVRGSLALLIIGVGAALFIVRRNRQRMQREIRLTRAQMASDLHDDVGSNLGTIVLHVEKLQQQADSTLAKNRLEAIFRLTRESVFGLREVLSTTAPEVGRTQDIVPYMRELASLIVGSTPLTFEAAPTVSASLTDTSLRKGLLLFFKEALHNAKKHSNCSQIDLSLQLKNQTLELVIKDNGQGIDEATFKKKRTLRTLKQRATWLDADLQIASTPAAGTELILTIPLGAEESR